MVGNARFVNVNSLVRKLGEIGISIVPNISVGFVFQKYGSNARPGVIRQGPKPGKRIFEY
jgi:hypothetical protein